MASVQTAATSFYSAGGNAQYKGWFGATVKTISATQCQITIEQYAGMVNGYGYAVNVQSYYRNGTSGTWSPALSSSGTLSSHPGSSWAWFAKKSYTSTVTRDSSTKYVQYYVTAACPSAPYSGGRSADRSSTLTVTIPALDAKTVYYNLNYTNDDATAPSGTPASQDAGAFESVTLAAAPSRTGYNFLNWNTAADGSGKSYPAGGTYSDTNTVTLYAIWQRKTGLPSITGLEVYRASDSSGASSLSGTWLYVTGNVNWGAQTTDVVPTADSVTVATRLSTASSYGTAHSATVTDGVITYSENGFNKDSNYDVLITVTNRQGVSAIIEQPNALVKDGYIIKVEPTGDNLLHNTASPTLGSVTYDVYQVVSGGNGTGSIETVTDSPVLGVNKSFRISGNTSGNRDFKQNNAALKSDYVSGAFQGNPFVFSCYVRGIGGDCTALIRVYGNEQNFFFSQNVGTNWERLEVPITLTGSNNGTALGMQFGITGAGSIEYIAPKLERGSKATLWSAAATDDDTQPLVDFGVNVTVPNIEAEGNVASAKDTTWSYIDGSASSTGWTRWRCKLGVVYVEMYYSNYSGAIKSTEWTSSTAIPSGYRPTKIVGAPVATFTTAGGGMWVTTDGKIHSQSSANGNYAQGVLSYPID